MKAKRLTALAVRNEKPRSVRAEVPDLGCRGLYLVVQPSGSKTWAVRFRFRGRSRKVTLGPAIMLDPNEAEPEAANIGNALTLSAARKLATAALHQVEQGIDPGEANAKRAAAAAAPEIFEAIADEYLNREGKRLRSAEEWRATLKRLVHPTLCTRQISDIRRSEIVRLLDKIEAECGAVMADGTLAVVRRIMNWHAARSDDFRSPIVRGMARTRPRERARDRVLTDDELRALWSAAEGAGLFGAFLRFVVLTGARRTEAARMTWGEISNWDWTLPAARNKTKIELVRPLSDATRHVLEAVARGRSAASQNRRSASTRRPVFSAGRSTISGEPRGL